jgi:hypothetical protein
VSDEFGVVAAISQPVHDMLAPPIAVALRGTGSALADVAPAGGFDVVVIGLIAMVVAGVLVLIVHSRRR